MIEHRKYTEIKLGNGDIVHRIVLESYVCPRTGEKADLIKHTMLKQICENPALAHCGTLPYETFVLKYINDRWVIELKATEAAKET